MTDGESEHWVEQLEAARQELAQAKRRQANGDRNGALKTAAVVVTFTSLIFTAGYNWRRIDELLAWQATHVQETERAQAQFVRKDVQTEQFRLLNERVDELIRQLERLEGTRTTRKE